MTEWLQWARGPAFRFALALMLLGIARLVVVNAINLWTIWRRAGDKEIPWGAVLRASAQKLMPFRNGPRAKAPFAVVSVVFHVAIIVMPILLAPHILLWERGVGISWPALGRTTADVLTLVAIVSALILFFHRALSRTGRALSRPQDYLLPLLLGLTCLAGFLAMHPRLNPFAYDATMLVHVLTGNLALAVLPFTKLSHAVLFPASQIISELGWHLAEDSGQAVAHALGKEGEPV